MLMRGMSGLLFSNTVTQQSWKAANPEQKLRRTAVARCATLTKTSSAVRFDKPRATPA